MLKFLKYLFLAFISLAGAFLLLSFVVGFIFLGGSRGCHKDSEAANYARSLTETRLNQLYSDMERYYHREDIPPYKEYLVTEGGEVPSEFSDLEVVRISPKGTHIMVEGCFDNYMYLQFVGIDKPAHKKILLQYGEFETITEVLWSE